MKHLKCIFELFVILVLWFPVIFHLTWNYVQGPVLGFAVSGKLTPQLLTQYQSGSALLTGGEFGFEGSIISIIILSVAIVAVYFHYNSKKEELLL